MFTGVMAHATVSDLERAESWYARVFDRDPDARPREGLLEWHFGSWGVQVFADPGRAGGSGMALATDDLTGVAARLEEAGVEHAAPFDATYSQVMQLADPDGNHVVITAPFAG